MVVDLDKKDLKSLVRGSSSRGSNHPLFAKAGHWYSDQYGRTGWDKLDSLTEEELYELYLLVKNE